MRGESSRDFVLDGVRNFTYRLIESSTRCTAMQRLLVALSRPTGTVEAIPAPAPAHTTKAAQVVHALQSSRWAISPERSSYKWWVAATVMLSAFLVVVSGSAMNVALPPMMTTLGLNLDQAQWIITAYMIAGAVLIPTVGWLG